VSGKPREIVSAELVQYATPSADPAEAVGDVEISTNEPWDSGRLVLLLVDQSNMRSEARGVLDAAARWVRSLGPKDRVGLFTFPVTGVRIDFTTDHEKVAAMLGRIVVQLALSGPARGAQVDLDVTPLGATTPVLQQTAPIVQTTGGQTVAHQTLKASRLAPGRYTLRAKIAGSGTSFARTFRVRATQ
jgi:hypothetical protein